MSFFYNYFGDDMKIYIDLLLFINFLFDFLLLMTVSAVLRRNTRVNNLLIGAFIGSLSVFFLFFDINSYELFILKLITSIFMVLMSFGYRNIKYMFKNLFYLYTISMLLGGFLYYLNLEFSYSQQGLVFLFKGYSINIVFLLIFSPIILYVYTKQSLHLKNNFSNYYKVDIYIKNKKIKCNAFLDTGNRLKDPYQNRPIILVNKNIIKSGLSTILIPYNTINEVGLLKCVAVDKIDIKGIGIKKNLLVGIMENNIKIDGVDCILHQSLMEEK